MTRPVLVLFVFAALICLAPLALLLGDDDDGAAPRTVRSTSPWERPAFFERLRSIELAPVTVREASSTSPVLATLDEALDHAARTCAPEMWGYDRAWLEKMQSDWTKMKPNMTPSWEAWLSLNGVVLDEDKLARCQEILNGDDCALMRNVWDPCTRPFTGALGEGEACETHEQCFSGACFDKKCTAPTEGCRSRAECGPGMVCARDDDGDTYSCMPAPKEGEPCAQNVFDEDQLVYADVDCAAGMKCSDDGTCATPRALFAECGPSAPCVDGAWCNDVDDPAICIRDDVGTDEGCSCDPERDGKQCVFSAEGAVSCVPVELVDLGGACDDTHVCAGALGVTACIDGRCMRALSAGDACSDHDNCKDDLVCIDGACSTPMQAGETCSDSDDCYFGLECVVNENGEGVCDVFKSYEEPHVIQLSEIQIDVGEDRIFIEEDVPGDQG